MSFGNDFGGYGVPTEQQQPLHTYPGMNGFYQHDAGTGVYGSNASLVLCSDGRTARSTPGMSSAYAGDRHFMSYSDQQLPLAVCSDDTMTIDDHTRYNSAYSSSNAHLTLVSPTGLGEDQPNLMCDSRNNRLQRLHGMGQSEAHSAASYHHDLSSSVASEGVDDFLCGNEGSFGMGHMVTGIGGGVGNGGGGFDEVEFSQLMEQITSPETSDPLLPQCSPVMMAFDDEANNVLRKIDVDQNPTGSDLKLIQDLEAFQATDIQFQQSATIYGDFMKAPVQVHPAEAPAPERRSQTQDSSLADPQSIEHDLEIVQIMRGKKNIPPQTLVLQNQERIARERCQEENLAVNTCTPAQVKGEFASPSEDSVGSLRTPLSVKAPFSSFGQDTITPVQVSAPSPVPPPTPMTPATPCPPSQKGPYELKSFSKSGQRCLTVSIRKDVPEEVQRMAYQANMFSLSLCRQYRDCLQKKFDLNMALNRKAEMCCFEFDQPTGQLAFWMPKECMHLDKWLSVHKNDGDLLERQMVVQQVANFLAAIHNGGSEDKLCLWGSFVVWVAPDQQVYVMVDFPEMLAKMDREQMNTRYDARVDDVKALYDLYKKVFEPYVKRGSSWVSPGVKLMLQSFEQLIGDPSSVYRMAELARTLGERRLCKLEVDIMTMMHTTYCIEHEKLNEVLSHFKEMLPHSCKKWQVQWLESHQPVGCDIIAVAQRRMQLRFAPMETSQELYYNKTH